MARTYKCCGCKDRFNGDLMLTLPVGRFCSKDCAISYANAKQDKQRAKQLLQQNRADTAVRKERKSAVNQLQRKTLKWQHKQTQLAFNKMRVLEELLWFASRGLQPTCISCGFLLGGDQWCCGHFKTRGSQPGLRYDRRNTFLQHNHRCNMRLSGDIEGTKLTRGYKKGLIKRFGENVGQEVIDYCSANTAVVKWQCDQLEEMRANFNSAARKVSAELNGFA